MKWVPIACRIIWQMSHGALEKDLVARYGNAIHGAQEITNTLDGLGEQVNERTSSDLINQLCDTYLKVTIERSWERSILIQMLLF